MKIKVLNLFCLRLRDTKAPLETNWGYGARENLYNELILKALKEKWNESDSPPPLLMKAAAAIESGFTADKISQSGYVGLLQVGVNEAKAQGLKIIVPLDAGIGTIKIKNKVIMNPLDQIAFRKAQEIENSPPSKETPEYAKKVAESYQKYGKPKADQEWFLTLGAYNGGGQTVLRAMAKAYDLGLDPRSWDNLINPQNNPQKSPLYQAIKEVYPAEKVNFKYKEMAYYPIKIFKLYRS
ncbi:MAG: hypothetical protein HYU63_04945 [Armatimonadetes bacterium]|nr:hypothetical protein [Armatimonadota bacterium]